MKDQKEFDLVIKRKKKGFTQVFNHFLEDPTLSWKAKGIYIYILSRPDNWKLNIKSDVTKRSTDKERAIYSGLKELIEQGYISRTRNKDFYVTYHLFEDKSDNDIGDYLLSRSQNADVQNADVQNAHVQNSDDLIRLKDNNTEDNKKEDSKPSTPSVAESVRDKNSKPYIINRLMENGLDEELAEEYWHFRANIKRDRPTNRGVSALINECAKHNIDLTYAVEYMIEKGWKGFKFEWMAREQRGQMPQMTKREQVEINNASVVDSIKDKIMRGEL